MWNINFTIPSLLILGVFFIYYISLPRLPISKNYIFINLVLIQSLVSILNVISSWFDNNYQLFSDSSLYLVNGLFFLGYFWCAYSFYLFTCKALHINLNNHKVYFSILNIPLILGVLIIMTTQLTRAFFYIDETGYHSSFLYNYLYFLFGFYILSTYAAVYFRRNADIRLRELKIVILYNSILLVGLIVRFIFPSLLIMDTFCFMAVIIIFLTFENPEAYLDERSYIFNTKAFNDYIYEICYKKPIYCFIFSVRNYTDLVEYYGIQLTNLGFDKVENFLKKEFPKDYIFYYRNARFIIFGDKKTDWNDISDRLHRYFSSQWSPTGKEIFLEIDTGVISLENMNSSAYNITRLFNEAFASIDSTSQNPIIYFNDSNIEEIITENAIRHALESAIDNDSVEVFLQPIIEAKTRMVAGAEALARIRYPDGKIIPPGLFIPVAEKNGRINQLGRQVFRKCCEFIKDYDLESMNLSFININLSPLQFMRTDLNETLVKFANETGADISLIHLEITEESMIDEQLMNNQITALTQLGFKFVLDDYGKGYSNMARLRKTPFINIKLDMSIVWDYCNNPDQLLPNEIKAFSELGFDITAEGIENEEMANTMADLGCTYLQGYYFSKPLSLQDFVAKYTKK